MSPIRTLARKFMGEAPYCFGCLSLLSILLVLSAPSAYGAAAIILSQNSGPAFATITVTGTGFTPNDIVRIDFGSQYAGGASASASGAFSTAIHVPADLTPGNYSVVATDTSSVSAFTPFTITSSTVPPTSPSTGPTTSTPTGTPSSTPTGQTAGIDTNSLIGLLTAVVSLVAAILGVKTYTRGKSRRESKNKTGSKRPAVSGWSKPALIPHFAEGIFGSV